MSRSSETIIRVAQVAGGPIVIGETLSADSVISVLQSTAAPVTVKAGNRSPDSLIRIAQVGGSRVTFDYS